MYYHEEKLLTSLVYSLINTGTEVAGINPTSVTTRETNSLGVKSYNKFNIFKL